MSDFSHTDTRPNEARLLNFLEEEGTDWEEIAKSLLGYLSDDEVRNFAESEGYDLFDNEEEEEEEEEEEDMDIKYFISALGYDSEDKITDFEKVLGVFNTLEKVKEEFQGLVLEFSKYPKRLFTENEPVEYWHIQLEECEVRKKAINCVDIIDEEIFSKTKEEN